MDLREIWIKYKKTILTFAIVFGITPLAIIKVASDYQQKLKWYQVSSAIYSAGFRGDCRLDYTGKVDIYRKRWPVGKKFIGTYDVEIRSTYTYDDFKDEMILVEWIFVIDGGFAEMYEAVYSAIWRSYHFTDKNGEFQWAYELIRIE